MFNTRFTRKIVLALAVLALFAGVFAFNFALPGHAIQLAQGTKGGNSSNLTITISGLPPCIATGECRLGQELALVNGKILPHNYVAYSDRPYVQFNTAALVTPKALFSNKMAVVIKFPMPTKG